jgi:alpha-tubulin suppressor-like RCC1 family protein
MAAGGQHTCAIGSDQSLWCWGSNNNGQLGDGSMLDQQTPQRVGADTDWTEIAAGGDTTCGLRTSGADTTLWCWGANSSKQVGIETSGAPVPTPTQIGTDTDFVSVTLSLSHTCAVRAGSSVRCWGANWSGQLGLGYADVINAQTYDSSTSLAPWDSVALGASFSCFGGTAGSVSCVGTNLNGELGRGFFTTVPPNQNGGAELSLEVAAGGISFTKITAGSGFVCGLTTQGDAGCWGSNLRGTVGSGLLDANNLPANANTMTMLPDSDWLEIGAGYNHVCGVKNVDELWCWGDNEYGQLGDPSLPHDADVMTPHIALSGAAFTTLKGGLNHTCGLKGDGSMWCWGDNEYGQTGFGHLWEQSPVDVVVK